MYELELDNGVIVDTYEEVILAHDLLITKNINDIDYNSIEKITNIMIVITEL